ncbi:hypothetical protein [Micromonospora okii]|uniref:hypothetical protein n=1 Tax=Micromonospora okii TaxID=1182970 RepID=UPI001E59489C|nr:hypothetical protein [Micromonospora okii]
MLLGRSRGLAVASVALLLLPGCSGPEPQVDTARSRELAMQDAGRKVALVEQAVKRGRRKPSPARRYAREAARVTGTEVLRTDDTRTDGGVSLVVRVHGVTPAVDTSGRAMARTFDLPVCYEIIVAVDAMDDRVDEVSCPTGPPLTVSLDPELPGSVEDDLRRALPTGAAATEQAVRAAVDGLDLEPLVARQVAAAGGVVGVALRASQYVCLLARVAGGRVEVWRPSRVQLAPGELSCTADVAVAGLGRRPPH